ncbi:fluoride efflux transporter FluC [Pelagibacterium xiamenense]|uniref:fluoride efflux transporter FluC n=1 Tax=Pelagibacterium xiamenense TaxID=2901140 RepID=UPI001E5F46C3|nr:CrcB family protein [Pelagibacterium xiamenense]MCD7058992.1 CrcB family protein [Pelagibacterium xiamenense]
MITLLPSLLLVAFGGAAGGVLRYWVARLTTDWLGHASWGFLVVNATGTVAIGLIAGLTLAPDTLATGGQAHWTLLATGALGSYTTVSSFSLQVLELSGSGKYAHALGYIAASFAACISGAALGLWLGWAL